MCFVPHKPSVHFTNTWALFSLFFINSMRFGYPQILTLIILTQQNQNRISGNYSKRGKKEKTNLCCDTIKSSIANHKPSQIFLTIKTNNNNKWLFLKISNMWQIILISWTTLGVLGDPQESSTHTSRNPTIAYCIWTEHIENFWFQSQPVWPLDHTILSLSLSCLPVWGNKKGTLKSLEGQVKNVISIAL